MFSFILYFFCLFLGISSSCFVYFLHKFCSPFIYFFVFILYLLLFDFFISSFFSFNLLAYSLYVCLVSVYLFVCSSVCTSPRDAEVPLRCVCTFWLKLLLSLLLPFFRTKTCFLFRFLHACLVVCLSASMSLCPFVYLFACIFDCLSVCLFVRHFFLQYICCLSVSMFFRLFHSIKKICLAACKLVCPSVGHSSKQNYSIINQFKLVFVNNIIISQKMFKIFAKLGDAAGN